MNWKILNKYIQGTCTEQELRHLGEWLQESPANEDFFKSFIENWDEEQADLFEADASAAWIRLQEVYNIPPRNEQAEPSGHPERMTIPSLVNEKYVYASAGRKSFNRGRLYLYSGVVAAIVLLVALLWVRFPVAGQVRMEEFTTTEGQRTNLKLTDGTLVTLNAESRLRIPENYGNASRIVYLEGEAFFDVEHNDAHPFIVITPRGYVKDLGTQFNVNAYDSTRIKVALKEGLASLGKIHDGELQKEVVKLTPGKLGVLDKTNGLTVSNISDMNVFTGWVEGKLVFRNTPFQEVVRRLERWFGIECEIIGPELSRRTLTAVYDNMPLIEILRVLSASLQVSYEQNKNHVIFRVDPPDA